MDTVLLTKADVSRDAHERAWLITVWVSGAFVLLLAALMVLAHLKAPFHDPLKSAALIAARQNARTQPKDEALLKQVRDVDLETRQGFFLRLARNAGGSWLLLGGLVLFIVAARKFASLHLPAPNPDAIPVTDGARRERLRSLAGVGVTGVVLLGLLGLLAVMAPAPNLNLVAANPTSGGGLMPTASAGPSETDYRANWPRFRGPEGNGVAVCTNAPTSFSVETGEHILWKADVPLKGFNSPVIWGNRIFFTGSDEQARELYCFDTDHGTLLWRLPISLVPAAGIEAMNIGELSGLTAPTVATDGERVYAMLTTGELVAADFAGKQVWSKNLGKPDNMYGHASSLITWRDQVLLQFDQSEAEKGKSKLIAFDGRTGNVIWQRARPVAASWTTPVIGQVGGSELIFTTGEPWALAYEPSEGKEVWRFGPFGTDMVPSPILANGLMVAIDAGRQVIAIKPDGQGDASLTHGVWTNQDNVPDITSPVSNGELLFTLGTGGDLACLDTASGKKLWEQNLKIECQASPTMVGSQLYMFSTEGVMVVVRVARQFAELARNKLGEPVFASPAVVHDRLYVRGTKHLFCFGLPAGKELTNAR